MNDSIFAEIDIEPADTQGGGLQKRGTAILAAEPVAPRTPDPVREKFYEMRGLATKRPYPRNDSELFYRQAKFMEDFTDDYDGFAAFNMYFPYYRHMGYEYLRTYFTWRTKVRGGEIPETSLSYVFLYIYELLSNIGVKTPEAGLDGLMEIWCTFSKQYDAIEKYLPKWLKDYHVFYELPHSFSDFIEEYNLKRYYSLTLLFDTQEGQLAMWNDVSGYDVTKSRFFKDGNEELLSRCFDSVIGAIQDFCEKRGASLEDLLVYSVSRRTPWQPFKNALFGSRASQNDREVHISKYERYYCKNGQWTANLPIYYSGQKDFIGYIIKKTEACLRAATGYKYKLAADMKPGAKSFRELQRTAAKRAELDGVIEKAAANFYRRSTRTVVTVDHKSLARIREEALETQEQLIVEEDLAATAAPEDTCANSQEALTDTVSAEAGLTLSFSDGWKALGKALTNMEKKALTLALGGKGDSLKVLANESGIMLEVLLDGINEKASDCIGDSLLEAADEVYVYDEYRAHLNDILLQRK